MNDRKKNIDILKAVCAFLIVCIHVPFPGTIGTYITALCRIAVPIFFMITGYFYSEVVKKNGEVRQIKKIFKLVVIANLIFLVWKSLYAVLSGNTDFFTNTFTFENLLKFVLFNESPLNGHLWYLGAILYVLIIVFVADKLKCRKLLYWMTPILLLGDLVLGKYSIVFWNREFPYFLVRNFLFVGIPFFCIGIKIKDGFGAKIGKNMLAGSIVLFSLTSFLERFILVNADLNATRDQYISTIFLAIAVFLFTLRCGNPDVHKERNNKIAVGKVADLLSVIGRKYSTWLYILHPIFITCIGVVAKKIGVYEIYKFVAPIVVYITTTVFLWVLDKLKSRNKRVKEQIKK